MTSSETRTDSRKKARKKRSNRPGGADKGGRLEDARRDIADARPDERAPIPRGAVWFGLTLLLFGGWIAIMNVNRWYFGPPVFFLCAGWLAVLLTGRFLWNAGMAAAEEDDGTLEDEFWRAEGPVDELQREKRSLLKAIKEIEFDREMGKMSDQDAKELTRFYRQRAIAIYKALERAGDVGELTIDEKIERELKARMTVAAASAKGKAAAQAKEREDATKAEKTAATVKAAQDAAARAVDLSDIASKQDARAEAEAVESEAAKANDAEAADAAVATMASSNEPELQKAEVGS